VTRTRAIRLIAPAAFLCALLSACATHRAAGPAPPPPSSADIGVGERAFPFARQATGGDFTALPELSAYVSNVGHKVVAASPWPTLPWDFVVIDDSAPNAWGLPGGKVGIHRGLLTELTSEAELAAVLGHQIAHAAETSGARRLGADLWFRLGTTGLGAQSWEGRQDRVIGDARLGPALTRAGYSPDDEIAADAAGMRAMAKAGYDPNAAASLLGRLLDLRGAGSKAWRMGLLTTHPPTEARARAARELARSLPPGGLVGEDEYRAAIAPLVALTPAYEHLADGEGALARGDAEAAAEPTAMAGAKAAARAGAKAAANTALDAAREAVAAAPDEPRFLMLEGRALLALKRPEEALAALDAAVKHGSGYFLPWLVRGEARQTQGDAAGARDDFTHSMALLPTDTANLHLGKLDLAEGHVDEGKRHLRAAQQAGGEAATDAGDTLARMEIVDVPGRYVAVGVGLTPAGFMFFTVENRAPLKVRGVTVRVTLDDPATGAPQEKEFTFEGPFEPQERARRDTRFGPFPPEVTRSVRTEVVAAHLVE